MQLSGLNTQPVWVDKQSTHTAAEQDCRRMQRVSGLLSHHVFVFLSVWKLWVSSSSSSYRGKQHSQPYHAHSTLEVIFQHIFCITPACKAAVCHYSATYLTILLQRVTNFCLSRLRMSQSKSNLPLWTICFSLQRPKKSNPNPILSVIDYGARYLIRWAARLITDVDT